MILAIGEKEPGVERPYVVANWRADPVATALRWLPNRHGPSWRRLSLLANSLLTDVRFMNVHPPSENWDWSLARRTATQIVRYASSRVGAVECVWLFGRRVQAAFLRRNLRTMAEWPFGSVASMSCNGPSVPYLLLPHPSGRNRWFNDPGNCEDFRRWTRSALTHDRALVR